MRVAGSKGISGAHSLIPYVRRTSQSTVYLTSSTRYKDRLWRFYQRLQADALLVRSCGALQQLLESKQQTELVGDFSCWDGVRRRRTRGSWRERGRWVKEGDWGAFFADL